MEDNLALGIGLGIVGFFTIILLCWKNKKPVGPSQYMQCPVLNENAAKVITVDMTTV